MLLKIFEKNIFFHIITGSLLRAKFSIPPKTTLRDFYTIFFYIFYRIFKIYNSEYFDKNISSNNMGRDFAKNG